MLKKELRVLGIDDAPFTLQDKTCMIIGVLCRGGSSMDGVMSREAQVDGEDATVQIIEMVNDCKWKPQLQVIFLDGIAVGGFNVINIQSVAQHTGIPVIVVTRHMPDFEKLEKTLLSLGMSKKYELMKKAGMPQEIRSQRGSLFIQVAGMAIENAVELLHLCCTNSNVPEAVRIAHLIGAGIVKGESKGRA